MMDSLPFPSKQNLEEDSLASPLHQALELIREEQLRSKAFFDEQLRLMRRQYEESVKTVREESRAWRTSSEDEFCRLVTTCTRQLTAMQEKFDRAVRHEAFVSRKLEELRQEKIALEQKVARLERSLAERSVDNG